ncbi:MAG: CPBP family intramembrane metalloprotease [Candidatus Azobacteroides sp.]|nr:CPBP family intramembrane metalloprotease [Candidatus Azobacteroides sp.]
MKAGLFEKSSFWTKIFIVLIVVLVGFLLTMTIYGVSSFVLYPKEMSTGEVPVNIFLIRLLQILQSFFVFIIPALLLAFWFSVNPNNYLYFEQKNNPVIPLLIIAASITIIPVVNYLAYLNEQIALPEALKGVENWMRKLEEDNEKIMEKILKMDSIRILWFNILLIGILAGVGEELFFRGIIQKVIKEGTHNIHLAIWLTAFIFSAIHMQFYGFFPRLLLGAYFGYLLWWTKSIWMPVLAHFANNTIAVMGTYMEQHQIADAELENIGSNGEIISLITSFILSLILISFIYIKRVRQEPSQ